MRTDCNGCCSKLKVGNKIFCIELEIIPDQPVEGCDMKGKGRQTYSLTMTEIQDINAAFESNVTLPRYYDPEEQEQEPW